jgi:type I restriction enzyme S subunit
MKGMISKGEFQKIEFLWPARSEQERFGRIFETQIKARRLLKETSNCAADLFGALSHRAFSGEI